MTVGPVGGALEGEPAGASVDDASKGPGAGRGADPGADPGAGTLAGAMPEFWPIGLDRPKKSAKAASAASTTTANKIQFRRPPDAPEKSRPSARGIGALSDAAERKSLGSPAGPRVSMRGSTPTPNMRP